MSGAWKASGKDGRERLDCLGQTCLWTYRCLLMIAKEDSEGSEDHSRESINHLREIYLNGQEQRKSQTLPYTILPTALSESEAPDGGRPLTNWGHLCHPAASLDRPCHSATRKATVLGTLLHPSRVTRAKRPLWPACSDNASFCLKGLFWGWNEVMHNKSLVWGWVQSWHSKVWAIFLREKQLDRNIAFLSPTETSSLEKT